MGPSDVSALYAFDCVYEQLYQAPVVGIDEAGRGPLAGPVVAAAVVLDLSKPIDGVFDSKQVAPKKRERLYDEICRKAVAWSVGQASHDEIDTYNILQATLLAMQRALDKITARWAITLVDGNCALPKLARDMQRTIIKGDERSATIAAASIIAKVTRDRIMEDFHHRYPGWNFLVHKGYPTAQHRQLIRQRGLCDIHRKSFCKKFITTL